MEFLTKLDIKINNKKLLETALTHSSYSHEHKMAKNYERLEFLGDSVLSLIISDYFYNFTNFSEGEMSKKRSAFVCEQALAFYAEKINLISYIKVGQGQLNNINSTIIADVFEAVIGVIYLDQGLNETKKFIYNTIIPWVKKDFHFFNDYKSLLQESIKNNGIIEYVLVKETGDSHDKTFIIDVKIGDITYGRGIGKNKKEAEQQAAKNAYQKKAE